MVLWLRTHRRYYRCREVLPPVALEWYYRWDQITLIEMEGNLHRSEKAQWVRRGCVSVDSTLALPKRTLLDSMVTPTKLVHQEEAKELHHLE